MASTPAFQPAKLPNGRVLKNHIVKAAMEENLADVSRHNQPSQRLIQLYDTWGQGGAGLILSGHVMLDPRAMASPGDILLSDDAGAFDPELWRTWMQRTQAHGAQFWLQLNHPGRQIRAGAGLPTYAPSSVAVDIGRMSSVFPKPLALTEEQIQDIIRRFAWAARKAQDLGAAGVEVHAAHGYLLSQFLSPRTNLRTDRYGGSLENRARMLFEVVRAIRAEVSADFGVAVKINSSDFQRGGFGPEDLKWVVGQLNGLGLDFVELSGGSYEVPAMTGYTANEDKAAKKAAAQEEKKASSTKAREAYFLQAAEDLAGVAEMPLMVTGGITRLETVQRIVTSGGEGRLRLAGVGSAMGLVPDLPNQWALGKDPQPHLTASPSWFLPQFLVSVSKILSIQSALHRVSKGGKPWPGIWPLFSIIFAAVIEQGQLKEYKKWMSKL